MTTPMALIPLTRRDSLCANTTMIFSIGCLTRQVLDFWTNQFHSCGDSQCLGIRVNVSAAFYLSIEFQQTGYLVERVYKAAYGDGVGTSTLGGSHQLAVPVVRLDEVLPDTQEIGEGVVVGQGNWQQQLETNKQNFTAEF